MQSAPNTSSLIRPGRTVGVSLAILASVMLFTVLPLLQIAMLLGIRYRFASVELPVPGETTNPVPMAVGGNLSGVDDITLVVQVVMGVVFLVIAFFAWRGRPAWIRLALLAAVLLLTVVTVALSVAPMLARPDMSQGVDSGADLMRVLLSSRLLMSILVAFYVAWYMNRGPARAFYRGYYLADPRETAE